MKNLMYVILFLNSLLAQAQQFDAPRAIGRSILNTVGARGIDIFEVGIPVSLSDEIPNHTASFNSCVTGSTSNTLPISEIKFSTSVKIFDEPSAVSAYIRNYVAPVTVRLQSIVHVTRGRKEITNVALTQEATQYSDSEFNRICGNKYISSLNQGHYYILTLDYNIKDRAVIDSFRNQITELNLKYERTLSNLDQSQEDEIINAVSGIFTRFHRWHYSQSADVINYEPSVSLSTTVGHSSSLNENAARDQIQFVKDALAATMSRNPLSFTLSNYPVRPVPPVEHTNDTTSTTSVDSSVSLHE